MTPGQDVITSHWNSRATSYDFNIKKDFFRDTVSDRWQDLLVEAIGESGPRKILDAGCGPAVLTRLLLDLGHEVTAVDISENMLALAKESIGNENSRVRFQQASVTDLPFEDASFDMVFSRYVIWTLPDPINAFREWQRVVKPGGLIGVIDGNWYYHYYRSGFRRCWSNLISFLYKVRAGFDPGQKLATGYAPELPCTQVLRPDWDRGVLAALGYQDVRVYDKLEQRIWGSLALNRLKKPWHHQFFITGRKAEGN